MAADPDNDLIVKAQKGDMLAKNELLRQYKPALNRMCMAYTRAPVPSAAIQGEAMKIFMTSVDSYNPKADVLFKTYLETQLRGLYRYVNSNKNVARVPEHRILQIRRFQQAKGLLYAQKDREPTNDELSDHLGWSQQQVQMMDTALSRRDLSVTQAAEAGIADPATFYNRMGETFEFMYFQMLPEEKLVYDYSLGAHGKPALKSVNEIAKKTGIPADRVYSIKRKLAKQVTQVV
jgi:DNA-directed RNA polymerase specialized sigma subunit